MIQSVGYPNLVNVQNQVAFKSNPVKQEKEKMNTTTKALIGAGALAATVVGGLLVHKKIQVNKLNKEISELVKDLTHQKEVNTRLGFTEIFDNNILQKHIDDAMKLPRDERLARLRELSKVRDDRGFCTGLKPDAPVWSKIDISTLPKEVQDAIASKDQFRAVKAYTEYCDTLFHKSKTAGRTIQESIDNVFGKNSGIKPHTYDLTKESDRIATAFNRSGFDNATVCSDNRIVDELNRCNLVSLYSDQNDLYGSPFVISQKMLDKKPVVTFTFAGEHDMAGNPIPYSIRLLSPNSRLTSAQQDLLKLKDAQDLNLDYFRTLLNNAYERVNYDAILSTIQTLAQKYKV